ncbi:hypothetical protein PENNAL_c0168G00806, partial [Penicillium nalgiovense]
ESQPLLCAAGIKTAVSNQSKSPCAKGKKYHKAWYDVRTAHGILVPGGFGTRGTVGMMRAAHHTSTKSKPYLGICLGMKIAVIKYSHNVLGLEDANSVELDERTSRPIVVYMPEIDQLRSLYGLERTSTDERHRHRYEVNPEYIEKLQDAGLHFICKDALGECMEIVELKGAPMKEMDLANGVANIIV